MSGKLNQYEFAQATNEWVTESLSLSSLRKGKFVHRPSKMTCYGKCSKNSNSKVSDKMTYANSADPDQTAPERAV